MRAPLRAKLVNSVLVAVAVGLVIAVVVTTGSVTTGEQEARKRNLLVRFVEHDLDRISIERGREKVVLRRDTAPDAGDAGWRLLEPVQEEPDPEAVQKLVGSLQFATVVRRIQPAEVDRTAFGLDAPRLVMSLSMGRLSYRLLLGKEAPSPSGAAYLEVGGDGITGKGVVVIRQQLAEELDVSLDDLRGHQLMPYLATALRGLTLAGKGGTLSLRREGGRWRFDGMRDNLLVERDGYDAIAVQLTRAKAEPFLKPATAAKAQKGAETVTVTALPTDASRPRAVVVFGGRCPDDEASVVAVRREPTLAAACVPRSVMPALRTPADQLVARTAFSLRLDQVEQLVAVTGKRRLEIARQDKGFVMRAPRQAEVKLEVGNQRIEALLALRGKLMAAEDAKRISLDPAHGKVTLKSAADTDQSVVEESVLVSAPTDDGRVYIKRETDGALLEVDREAARVLEADATLLRDLQVLDFAVRDVRGVQVEWDQHKQHVTRNQAGGIRLEKPEGFGIDSGQATALMTALGSLTADRWVADQDDGSFGFDPPSLRCRVTVAGGDAGSQEHELIVGEPASGGAYARLGSDPGVFVLPRSTLQRLQIWVLDRGLFVARGDEVLGLELQTKSARVELRRQGSRFVQRAGKVKLTPQRIQQIVQALSEMRAEAAVHTGPPRREEGLGDPELVVRIDRATGSRLPTSWRAGAGDSWRAISIYYARAEGVDATYVIARSKVQQIIDAL